MIIITNKKKNCLQEDAAGKKLFAQTTTQKKIVCLEKIVILPLQKNNGLSLTRMGSRERPRDEAIESGRLRERWGEVWGMFIVTDSVVVMILNSF